MQNVQIIKYKLINVFGVGELRYTELHFGKLEQDMAEHSLAVRVCNLLLGVQKKCKKIKK